MINEHDTWCNVEEHERDPQVGCFSAMSIVGGVHSWLVNDAVGTGVVVLAQSGRLDATDLRALIDQLQRYEVLLAQRSA